MNLVVLAYNPTLRIKVGESGVQGQPWLHNKFKTSLTYMTLNKEKRTKYILKPGSDGGCL